MRRQGVRCQGQCVAADNNVARPGEKKTEAYELSYTIVSFDQFIQQIRCRMPALGMPSFASHVSCRPIVMIALFAGYGTARDKLEVSIWHTVFCAGLRCPQCPSIDYLRR